ncbi:hypothetical protein ATANTOWER_000998 [Ataeniobius toweri]|uniref:Uncharacterized protein n=1 Tax=Ataeniobius toweri TaxID=208326 RepID=A0ABU7B6I7_9TELE|nr:hypothetical protein [Ataeniobius toweri]
MECSSTTGAAVSELTIRHPWVASLSAQHSLHCEIAHSVRPVMWTLRLDIRPALEGRKCSYTDHAGCDEASSSSLRLLLLHQFLLFFGFFQLLLALCLQLRLHH